MVSIKRADSKLSIKDLWPDAPWTWDQMSQIKKDAHQRALDKGCSYEEVTFSAAREYEDFMSKFPSYGERQRILRRIYPEIVNPYFALSEEEIDYLIEKLHGANEPIGHELLQKLKVVKEGTKK